MTDTPEVSYIIPSYRSRKTISATLDSLMGQRYPGSTELIIVESSGDDTAAWIRQRYSSAQVIQSPVRLLPGAARNLGVENSRGGHLAFLDADVVAEPDWLEVMLATFTERPETSLVGGWIGNANPERVTSRVLHWIEFSESLPGLPSSPRSRLASCNWLIRRLDLIEAGGFSETFAMSEDMLLSARLNGRVYFQGKSGVWHTQRVHLREVVRHLRVLGHWSGRNHASAETEGSLLARIPWATFGLPFLRGARIVRRAFRSSWKEGFRCLVHVPLLLCGLAVWSWGFFWGVRTTAEGRSDRPI